MSNMIGKVIAVIGLVVMTGCATGQTYTWQDINREVGPGEPKTAAVAYLKVYTEAARVNEDGHTYNIRLPYTIFSADGKRIRRVRNRYAYLVTLPPGKYVIVPDGWKNKDQIIGAVLEPGELTEVHLTGS